MDKLLIATHNKGKLKEFSELFKGIYEVVCAADCGFTDEPEENGATFAENATIKARAVGMATGMAALADDSGLCVDYLSGAPGVYSARYAGAHANDKQNNEKLLREMTGASCRSAKFVCSLAFYDTDGSVTITSGECLGQITLSPVGDGGFGYDCLFYSSELKKTFGQASDSEKNLVSHRARAAKAMLEVIRKKRGNR